MNIKFHIYGLTPEAISIKYSRLKLLDVMGINFKKQMGWEKRIINRISHGKYANLLEFFKLKDDELFK